MNDNGINKYFLKINGIAVTVTEYTRMSGESNAKVDNDPDYSSRTGDSPSEALGDLILSFPSVFGIEVVKHRV